MNIHRWNRSAALRIGFVCLISMLSGCGEVFAEGTAPQAANLTLSNGVSLNGIQLNEGGTQNQGPILNEGGTQNQGPRLEGHTFDNAFLNGQLLSGLRVEAGELVAELEGVTVRGTQLTGAIVRGRVVDESTTPATVTTVEHRISAIQQELATYELGPAGTTYLYTVERYQGAGSWAPLCTPDRDGAVTAIPIAAVWDGRATRVESDSAFTFACTSGAIGKCYRWGYRPWTSHSEGPQVMKDAHQACIRLTRADYCGDGVPHTETGTQIVVWDTLTAPGPFQTFVDVEGNYFEAAWTPNGAACLSHPRWVYAGQPVWPQCADRALLPCTLPQRLSSLAPTPGAPRLFTESAINVAW